MSCSGDLPRNSSHMHPNPTTEETQVFKSKEATISSNLALAIPLGSTQRVHK